MPSGFPGWNLCYLTSTAKSIFATLLRFRRCRASLLRKVLHATKQCVAVAVRRRCDSHYPGGFALHQPHYYAFSRSEEHTSELQSRGHLVCRLLLEKKKTRQKNISRQNSRHRINDDE